MVGQHPFRLSILGKATRCMRSCCGFKVTTNSTYYANVYMCSEQLGAKPWPAWRSRTVSSTGLENVACAGVGEVVTVLHGRGTRTGR